MAVSLGEAILKIGADSSSYERKLARLQGLAKKSMDDAATQVLQSTKNLMLAGAGVIAAGVAAIFESVLTTGKLADDMDEMAQRTGFSPQALMKWKYAMDLTGGSIEQLEVGIRRMQRSLFGKGGEEDADIEEMEKKLDLLDKRAREARERYDDTLRSQHVNVSQNSLGIRSDNRLEVEQAREKAAREYNEAMEEINATYSETVSTANEVNSAYAELGLNQKALQEGSPEDALLAVVVALSQVANKNKQAELSMAIFGKAGTNMLPVLEKGKQGLAAMIAEAEKLGVVLSPARQKASKDFTDNVTRLQYAARGVAYAVGGALIPQVEKYVTFATDWVSANRELVAVKVDEWVKKLGDAMKVAWPYLRDGAFFLYSHLDAITKIGAAVLVAAAAWKTYREAMAAVALLKIIGGAGAEASLAGGAAAAGGVLVTIAAILPAAVASIWGNWKLWKENKTPDVLKLGATSSPGGQWEMAALGASNPLVGAFVGLSQAAAFIGRMSGSGGAPFAAPRNTALRFAYSGKQLSAAGESPGFATVNIHNLYSHANDPAQLEKDITKQAAKKLP